MPTNPRHLRPPEANSRDFLRRYTRDKRRRREPVQCLQIGANDGRINDPVYPFVSTGRWDGLLVEPLVDVFTRELSVTYAGHPNVILENAAIAPQDGTMTLYRVGISDARWATGLSSFVRDTIVAHIENGYVARKASEEGVVLPPTDDEIITSVSVPTLTMDSLLKKHAISSFDVLCVDTEGYDHAILSMVDLAQHRPDVILFESKNIPDDDYAALLERLRGHGYSLYWDNGDTLATQTPFRARWQHALRAERTARTKLGTIKRLARR